MTNGQVDEPKAWFALQVRSRWENATEGLLQNKGFETLLPTYPATRRWSDRFKVVESPLFPGYVFCRFDVHNRLPVLITPGVISVVGRGKTPVAVDDAEILSIQTAIASGIHMEPWPYVEIGERVRIKAGVLSTAEQVTRSPETVGRIYESKWQYEWQFQPRKITDDKSRRNRLRVLGSERGSEPFWCGPHVRRNAMRHESQRARSSQEELSQPRGHDRP